MKYSLFDLIMAWLRAEFRLAANEEFTSSGWYSRRSGWLFGNKAEEIKGTAINYRLMLGPNKSYESEILSITSNDEITVPGEYAGPNNPAIFKIYDKELFNPLLLHKCVSDRIMILRRR